MEVGCSTEPLDASSVDESVRSRWFLGLGNLDNHVGPQGQRHKTINPGQSSRAEGRFTQRISDDSNNGIDDMNEDIDPRDLLEADGMSFSFLFGISSVLDNTTPYVIITDSFGRERKVREGSKSANMVRSIAPNAPMQNRQLASYDDI
jgi:hypothetical protein